MGDMEIHEHHHGNGGGGGAGLLFGLIIAIALAVLLWFVVLQPRRQRTDVNIKVDVPEEVNPPRSPGNGNR
jgi:peptidoglycan/LPS O-acetylase OafA/YrhL